MSRLTNQTEAFFTRVGNLTRSYSYNPASQIATRSTSNDAYVHTSDPDVSRSYSINGLNQYTAAGPASFTYDANGNLTGDGSNTYAYDVENRLIGVSGARTASLIYDPLGRLFETSNAPLNSGGKITRFVYDGDALVEEYNGSHQLLRRYVHGADSAADDPLFAYEGAGLTDRRSLHVDHQGSIIASANTGGTLRQINSYDEYGIPAPTNQGRFQYTGQAWLPEIGMYYYKARIYSPTLGRFLQTDPIGYDDGLNWYAYVGNDPVNLVDPDGKEAACITSGGTCTDPSGITVGKLIDFATTTILIAADFLNGPTPDVGAAAAVAVSTGRAADKAGDVARATVTARGRASEARVLKEVGATKNTSKADTSFGKVIRDGTKKDSNHLEVKDTKRLDATRQVRGLDEAAGKAGKSLEIRTGTNTNVSRNVNKDELPNTTVTRCPTLGPKC